MKSCVGIDVVPLRRAGLGAAGHRPRAALPGPAGAAQDQARRVRLRPRVRRGAEQGRRRHRHRAGLEPLRRRQRRHAPGPRRAARRGPRHRDARPLRSTATSCGTSARPSGWSARPRGSASSPGGIDFVRRVVVDDELGIGAELEADMARHVESYQCEWAATLDDPARLARFVVVRQHRRARPDRSPASRSAASGSRRCR